MVAFTTHAPNLGAVVHAQIDVWRAATDSVSIESTTPVGTAANERSFSPSLSADGSKMAFESQATDLGELPAAGVVFNAWWRDLATGTTRLASRADGAAGATRERGLLPAGDQRRRLAGGLSTVATNLGDGDTTATLDVHVRDIPAGATLWAAAPTARTARAATGPALYPSLTADGGVVAFESVATNLTGDDADAVPDIFTRDLGAGRTTLVSRASGAAGDKGTKRSVTPLISGDGRRVAFKSFAPNLAPDDANALDDVFVRDLTAHDRRGLTRGRRRGDAPRPRRRDGLRRQPRPALHRLREQPAGLRRGRLLLAGLHAGLPADAVRRLRGQPGGPGRGPRRRRAREDLEGLLRPKAFRPRARKRGGAILRFTLSEKARVRVAVQRPLLGHRRGERCAVRFRSGKRCIVWKTVGSLTLNGKAGANRTRFTARLKGRALAPRRYRLRLVATKAGRPPSVARTVRFRITPPPAVR